MENYPLISVIVPIYQVEKYIDKCISSIINQTYKNLEIILVDDGSLDNCPKICDNYAMKDNRVQVIHKANGGLSDARNAGLDIAKGQFISFIDSDDWIEHDMYEIMLCAAMRNEADLVECGVNKIFGDRIECEDNAVKETILTNYEASDFFLTEKLNIKGTATNKLYHKNICDKVEFPIGRLHEDAFFTYKALYYCRKFVKIHESKYNYVQERPGSIMTKNVKSKNITDVLDAFEERNSFFLIYKEKELYKKSQAYYFRTTLTYYLYCKNKMVEEKELVHRLEKILDDSRRDVLSNKYLGIRKLKFVLYYLSPKLLSKYSNIS